MSCQVLVTKDGISVCYKDHDHFIGECEREEYIHKNFVLQRKDVRSCLGCGKELPHLDEMAKKMGRTGDLDLLICSCNTVMVHDVETKRIRPPHVDECRVLIDRMLPKVVDRILGKERTGKCPECGEIFNRMTYPQDPSQTPEPGCYTLCAACGAVGVFDENLELRRPTKEEQESKTFQEVLRASAQLQVMLAERESKKP